MDRSSPSSSTRFLVLEVDMLTHWACTQCGAPLPEGERAERLVTCTACGTRFVVRETAGETGVVIQSQVVTIGGDVIHGDKIVHVIVKEV